jgi:hypothetical protein
VITARCLDCNERVPVPALKDATPFVDDWLVIAYRSDDPVHNPFVITEMWQEWGDESDMPKAEKRVLRAAMRNWDTLNWQAYCEDM